MATKLTKFVMPYPLDVVASFDGSADIERCHGESSQMTQSGHSSDAELGCERSLNSLT